MSIDFATDDALDAVRANYPHSPSHRRTRDGVINVLDGHVAFGRVAQLVGHGAPGLLTTGCGQNVGAATTGQLIDVDMAAWLNELQPLRGEVKALRLTGCRVGAEQRGLDLLREVSCIIDAPVLAPTGAIRANQWKMWMQDGGTWQIGQCGYEGTVVAMTGPTDKNTQWNDTEGIAGARVEELRLARFTRPGYLGGESVAWEGDAARELVLKSGLMFRPDEEPGETLGIPTGTLTLTFSDDEELVFDLLGEAVLTRVGGRIAYFATADFLGSIPPYQLTL
ncbi:MAG: hypothetical protein ACRDKE_04255 [Solirubrobacterales bacterium]